jgi:ATP-dependent protease ClpP protease subunit
MNAILSKATGRSPAEIQADAERDVCLSAEEARGYGLIDLVAVGWVERNAKPNALTDRW